MRTLRPWVRLMLMFASSLCATGAAQAAETVTYYYTNQQGTVLAMADSQGSGISTADYRPYGAQSLGTVAAGPGYTGHVNDMDTGFVYMQARYYDSSVGRFLSTDLVTPAAGDAFNFNRYSYASNSPVVNIDPDGMQDCAAGQGDQKQVPCPPSPPSKPPPKPDPNQAPVLSEVIVTATTTSVGTGVADGLIIRSPAFPRWLVAAPNPWVVLVVGLGYPGNMAACQEVSCMPTLVFNLPPGFWPADKGAEEWGRRNGVDPAKARKKFHDIKQSDTTNKGGKREWGGNPETGEVRDPGGEIHGELSK
ncbi:RHS repeat-associated core domain-containing protein [Luteibacter rhizovicinus]|nr:RHS repeat-associated core domain-containing protein [Luteibacter rhizovicinus]